MDLTQALKDTENVLRGFIAQVMQRKLGSAWMDSCGVSADRVAKWRERKATEEKRQQSGVVEERLLFYADFYDLSTILSKQWSGEFAQAFGDWATMKVWLSTLESFRDPDAHRRELLPHQKHLALGIAGEIRTRLIRFRSKIETAEDCYPRIESARDSLGHIIVPDDSGISILDTGDRLRVGDTLEFLITASDPLGAALEYRMSSVPPTLESVWQAGNEFQLVLTKAHRRFEVGFQIRSPREHHAGEHYDASVIFSYEVLPTSV